MPGTFVLARTGPQYMCFSGRCVFAIRSLSIRDHVVPARRLPCASSRDCCRHGRRCRKTFRFRRRREKTSSCHMGAPIAGVTRKHQRDGLHRTKHSVRFVSAPFHCRRIRQAIPVRWRQCRKQHAGEVRDAEIHRVNVPQDSCTRRLEQSQTHDKT